PCRPTRAPSSALSYTTLFRSPAISCVAGRHVNRYTTGPDLYDVKNLKRKSDPYGTRTRVTAVKGRCLNRLTNGPYIIWHEIQYRSEEHTSELQSRFDRVCRLL